MTSESTTNGVPYAIPKKGQDYLTNPENHALKIIKDLGEETLIKKNANLVNGCNQIEFNNNFVSLLDQAYKSFLMSMYYSSVSLCGMAVERICYDFIHFSEISIDKRILNDNQRSQLFNIPLRKLMAILMDLGFIDHKIINLMTQINDNRNRYVHPSLKNINPTADAMNCLNNLCKIIDLLSQSKKRRNQKLKSNY